MYGLFSKKKKKKKQIGRRNCKTSQAFTSFYQRVKEYKENPFIERKGPHLPLQPLVSDSLQGKIKVLFFCSFHLLHVISIFAVIERMKRVLKAAFRNFALKPYKQRCQDPVFHRPVRVQLSWSLNVQIDLLFQILMYIC